MTITAWTDIISRSLVHVENIPTRDAAEALLRQADAPGAPQHPGWRGALVDLVAAYDCGIALGRAGAWVPLRTLLRLDGRPIVDAEGRPVRITLAQPRGSAPPRWWVGQLTPHPADTASALTRAGYVAVEANGFARVLTLSPRGVHATHRT